MQELEKTCPRCGTRYDAKAAFCQLDGERLELVGAADDPYVGRVLLDQFRIDAVLGRGGMGTVYRARQLALGRDVALKVLNPELVRNTEAFRRFQREVRVATAIEHPNVVRVFLFGQLPDGSLYLVMEFLDGIPLSSLLAMERVLPLARAVHVLEQIARGLGAAHAKGIVHRDVKPENVLLVREGDDADFVKLLDFGIARMLEGDSSGVTKTGVIFGTARYMSPEGAQGEPTDARSDVYSLGVLAYQLFTGETPFDGPTPVAMLLQHVQAKPPDVRGKMQGADLPNAIADLVMRSLSKKASARPSDGNAFADALVRAVRETDARRAAREEDDTTPWRRESASDSEEAELAAPKSLPSFRILRAATGLLVAFLVGASAAYVLAIVREGVEGETAAVEAASARDAGVEAPDASASLAPPVAPSLRVTPSAVAIRRPFAVEIVASPQTTDLTVEVKHGTHRVAHAIAAPTPTGTFAATLTVDRAGHYVVEAHVGETVVSAPLDVIGPRPEPSGPMIFQGGSQ